MKSINTLLDALEADCSSNEKALESIDVRIYMSHLQET